MVETMERKGSLRLNCDDEIISDEAFENMLEALDGTADDKDVSELLQVMNENRIISREEADQILEIGGPNTIVKCGLPPHVRPSDPENTTDPEECISRILKDDPTLVEVNMNNMKRTPIPVIQRLLMALKENSHLKKLQLANTGLSDTGAEPLLETLEENTTLEMVNLETNFLSGDFLARLFKAALKNQTLREIKAVNQSPTFSTEAEMEIMKAVHSNRGLTKVSVNLRHPEAKNKIELACLRNGELRRQQRRLEQLLKQQEATQADGKVENKAAKTSPTKPATTVKAAAPVSKVAEKKPAEKPTQKVAPPSKKEPVKKAVEKPAEKTVAASNVKKEQNGTDIKPLDEKKQTEKEKIVEKNLAQFEKKANKEKTTPAKKEIGKKTENDKEKTVDQNSTPARKTEKPKEAPAVDKPKSEKPAVPKPTLGTVAKEAATKAASRNYGSTANDSPIKKKLSIGDRSKASLEDTKPIDTMSSSPRKTSVTRPGSLNVANKDIPTSKGLGATTFGSSAKPASPTKPMSPTKPEASKLRRGSGSIKTPTAATPTTKTETASKPWATKPPGSSSVGSKVSDVKSKFDSFSSSSTAKPYGFGGKKRDSVK